MSFTADSIKDDNICVIWVDDMIDVFSWRDSFGVRIETPNIDRLMARGVRFSNAYATVPLCAPCRAELATGLSPFRTGLVDLNRVWYETLPAHKSWAYDLRRAGFYNFTTGKVDAHYTPMPPHLKRLLFHEAPKARDKGGRSGVHDYLGKGPGIKGINHPTDDGSQDKLFYDFDVAQNAIDFLGRAKTGRRHLIQLGFKHPHYNLDCPDRFYQMYDVSKIRWPEIAHEEDYYGPPPGFAAYEACYITNGTWIPENAGDEAWRQVVRGYFAAISHVDHEIGRFLDALEASPLGDKTTVIFLSDNGFNLGTHDSFHKMSQWDSAAHIPFSISSPRMRKGRVVTTPISLHNFAKTIFDLAGLPYRPDWVSGQSLLPLIDSSFGQYDTSKSPITCVFGTLSVRPSVDGYDHLRYFRYPNGEEHVYDIVQDPGETVNLADSAPMDYLRSALVVGALDLGLDLRGFKQPAPGVRAMMAVDGAGQITGGKSDANYWAYGQDAERIREERGGGEDTLWYLGGPDDYTLQCPANVEKIRIATVVARNEGARARDYKVIKVAAHPNTAIDFETSERVLVTVKGSNCGDILVGPKYGGAQFDGGKGNDRMQALSQTRWSKNRFYGGAGNDTLIGGQGRDILDGGTGDDHIVGNSGRNQIFGGHGNDTISDIGGESVIHTGPGRNNVEIGPGQDTLYIGRGINFLKLGCGAKTLHFQYGGVSHVKNWDPEQIYYLADWPRLPEIHQTENNRVSLRLGASIIHFYDCAENIDPRLQVVGMSESSNVP